MSTAIKPKDIFAAAKQLPSPLTCDKPTYCINHNGCEIWFERKRVLVGNLVSYRWISSVRGLLMPLQ